MANHAANAPAEQEENVRERAIARIKRNRDFVRAGSRQLHLGPPAMGVDGASASSVGRP